MKKEELSALMSEMHNDIDELTAMQSRLREKKPTVTVYLPSQKQYGRLRLIVTSILRNSGTEDMNNGACCIHNHFCIYHATDCSHEKFLGGREKTMKAMKEPKK